MGVRINVQFFLYFVVCSKDNLANILPIKINKNLNNASYTFIQIRLDKKRPKVFLLKFVFASIHFRVSSSLSILLLFTVNIFHYFDLYFIFYCCIVVSVLLLLLLLELLISHHWLVKKAYVWGRRFVRSCAH